MTKKPQQPKSKDAPKGREERLKAALKANLSRRKAQARIRKSTTEKD